MRILTVLLSCIFLFSCAERVSEQDLELLNGYWEIEEVVFADGNRKEYGINTIIEFIEYNNKKGFRKKVQPMLNGTFITSDDAETFELVEKNNKFIVLYKNDLSEWEEEIKSLSAEKLVLAGEAGVVYYYKRFEGILDNQGGKEK